MRMRYLKIGWSLPVLHPWHAVESQWPWLRAATRKYLDITKRLLRKAFQGKVLVDMHFCRILVTEGESVQ